MLIKENLLFRTEPGKYLHPIVPQHSVKKTNGYREIGVLPEKERDLTGCCCRYFHPFSILSENESAECFDGLPVRSLQFDCLALFGKLSQL